MDYKRLVKIILSVKQVPTFILYFIKLLLRVVYLIKYVLKPCLLPPHCQRNLQANQTYISLHTCRGRTPIATVKVVLATQSLCSYSMPRSSLDTDTSGESEQLPVTIHSSRTVVEQLTLLTPGDPTSLLTNNQLICS